MMERKAHSTDRTRAEILYQDILYMPRPVSTKHAHMSVHDRAAQFSAFAALTGHDAAIQETARYTDSMVELDEYSKALLDRKLQELMYGDSKSKEVEIIYFEKDLRKEGGSYRSIIGQIKKADMIERLLFMKDGTVIELDSIYDISGAE